MREQVEREPFHTDKIVLIFRRNVHITDVAYEAVMISRLARQPVVVSYDRRRFEITPAMDVPDVAEAYKNSDGPHVAGNKTSGLVNITIKEGKIADVRPA